VSPNWLNVAGCDGFLSTEGAKVSNLFDIGQHNKYFIDYRNQNKSSQKAGVAGWRRRHHSPTGVSWCNGKSTNSPQSRVINFFL